MERRKMRGGELAVANGVMGMRRGGNFEGIVGVETGSVRVSASRSFRENFDKGQDGW